MFRNTNHSDIAGELFRGKIVDRLICPFCGEIRSCEEAFTSLSVEVKDVSSLEESIERYGAVEEIEGTFPSLLKSRLFLHALFIQSVCQEKPVDLQTSLHLVHTRKTVRFRPRFPPTVTSSFSAQNAACFGTLFPLVHSVRVGGNSGPRGNGR